MQTITLYRTIAAAGRVTVSPNEPEHYDSTLCRLVADEGKELVKDECHTMCIDTDTAGGWSEQDAPDTELIAEEKLAEIEKIYEEADA